MNSIVSRTVFKAISMGIRTPRSMRLAQLNQYCRTIDEINRLDINLVIDVGANRGFYSQHLRDMGYKGHIMAFEPEPHSFAILAQRARNDRKWQVFNCGLGDAPGELEFFVANDRGETVMSSLLKVRGALDVTSTTVTIKRLEDALAEYIPVSDPHIFLKMDTQGYDLQVFNGGGTLAGVDLLQSEISVIPLYDGMPHFTKSLLRYEQAGFSLLDLFIVGRKGGGLTGPICEYDALLARC